MKTKKTIIARSIGNYPIDSTQNESYCPKSGDLAVFEVLEIGKHSSVQSETGRNAAIFPGDYIVAAFANRYATSQFEGYVPDEPQEIYHILGAGGAIGIVHSKNDYFKDIEPTTLRMVGYCTDKQGEIINTYYYNTPKKVEFGTKLPYSPTIFLSIGSTMDSGKTTSAAFLSRGLKYTGKKVAFIKFTGTCYTKDQDFVRDCGADVTTDFSDLGYPSTYMCSKEELLDLYTSLLHSLADEAPDYIVMEIADGLMQRETNFLLKDKKFMATIDGVIFSCGDSLSAFHGVQLLNGLGITPNAVSGKFTMSPLLIKEVQNHIDIPVVHIDELMMGTYNHLFLTEEKKTDAKIPLASTR